LAHDTTVSEMSLPEEKKLYGRKTGWCNNPSSDDPKESHSRCDGEWWTNQDGETLFCPCDCHDLNAIKLANAKKKEEARKQALACSDHPKYGGLRKPRTDCEKCWGLYTKKNPEKVHLAS